MKKVIVVGAGVSGLAAAIRLQYAGYQVEILEKEATPGGKMNQVEVAGYRFDLGPTIVMMPNIYREIFEHCGRDPEEYIPMEKINPMYQVYFQEDLSDPLPVSSDLVKWTRTLEGFSPEDAEGFFHYLHDLYEGFHVAWESILQRPFRKQSDFYTLSMLKKGLKMKAGRNATHFMDKYIQNERIKQMIRFQTLYIGISSLDSPSFYTMIPAIQFVYGVWFIKGGMYTMATSMEKLFEELGGTIRYQMPVTEVLIKDKRAVGVKTPHDIKEADYILCSADFPYAMKHLVQNQEAKGAYTDQKIDKLHYSCSCFVMYLGMERKYDELPHLHNFIFSRDFDQNMRDIVSGTEQEDPSFYVYIASKLDPSLAPSGKDGLYLMTPVSNAREATYEWDARTIQKYRTLMLGTLKKIKGLEQIESEIVVEKHFTPADFESSFNAYNGAAFGLMPSLLQSGHLRPQSKSKTCENLYFAGSSTHPGAGVPMVLLSAKIAAQELLRDDQGREFDY